MPGGYLRAAARPERSGQEEMTLVSKPTASHAEFRRHVAPTDRLGADRNATEPNLFHPDAGGRV